MDLVSEGEDLGVTPVATDDKQPDSSDDASDQMRHQAAHAAATEQSQPCYQL